MPNRDAPFATVSHIALSNAVSRNHARAAANEPTPGSTIFFAEAMTEASRDSVSEAPAAPNARAMFATFATGESMRIR